MTPKSKTALFAGSFRPFTIGHLSIVERTLKLCDTLVIAVGINPEKPGNDEEKSVETLREIFENNPRIRVASYSGLTVDFARECGAYFMVRGVRGVADFEYEKNLAEVNLRISGIETVLLPAIPELAFVSSSMVRELASFGKDVSEFVVTKENIHNLSGC